MLSTHQAPSNTSKPLLQLENYNGPLALLLHLIEQDRLDVTAISLAQVADQYMATIAAFDSPDPDALAEFLVIGAKLLVIKTRALLPRPPVELASEDEEDVGDQLTRQLLAYQRFKQAAAQLRAWEQEGRRAYTRRAAPPLPAFPPRPAKLDLQLADLVAAVQGRMQLILPLNEPTALPAPKMITIADVRARVHEVLTVQQWTSFEDLLSLAMTRNEVIVTLWTVLELFKRNVIVIEQHDLFGSIAIGRGTAFQAFGSADQDSEDI